MSTVTAGNQVTLDAHFGLGGSGSPDAVTFVLEMPDNTTVEFVFGVDAQVTNPSADYYECALGVLHEITEYRWRAVGYQGSTVVETIYGTVFVIPSAVDPEQLVPPGPMLGPAVVWITGEDVAECVSFDYGSNPAIFDTVAYEASMALYEISGRVFPGLQDRVVRPCQLNCSCWAPVSYGLSPWWWGGSQYGVGGGWAWYNERGDRLGCSPLSVVRLAGYPVREITEVLINGEPLLEFEPVHGYRQWRLDSWRNLVRMDVPPLAPSDVPEPRFWPGCQNLALDSDQPGTFEISYKWGAGVPELGRAAAVEVAQQLWYACGGPNRSGAGCILPAGVTKVVRQEITIERQLLANWLDASMSTGLVQTDLFLQAYAGGMRRGRRSAVYSPDLQTMARRVGT